MKDCEHYIRYYVYTEYDWVGKLFDNLSKAKSYMKKQRKLNKDYNIRIKIVHDYREMYTLEEIELL